MANENEQNGIYFDIPQKYSSDDELFEQIKKKKNIELNELINRLKSTPLTDGNVIYLLDDKKSFIDTGSSMHFEKKNSDEINDEEILAMILLAKEKYNNNIKFTGTPQFKEKAIKLIIEYDIKVNLTEPSQYALFNKLKEKNPNESDKIKDSEKQKKHNGIIKLNQVNNQIPIVEISTTNQSSEPDSTPILKNESYYTNDLRWVNRLAEWEKLAEYNNSLPENEKIEIGDKPSIDEFDWIKKDGSLFNGKPIDFDEFFLNYKQEYENMSNEKPILAMKGSVLINGHKKDNVLLWKNPDQDYLSGIIQINEKEKINVYVFPTERKDRDKPNFLSVSQLCKDENGKGSFVKIGIGNAVNQKKDSTESVNFNEVLFSINPVTENSNKPGSDKYIFAAKTNAGLDDHFHARLGFTQQNKLKNTDDTSASKQQLKNEQKTTIAPENNGVGDSENMDKGTTPKQKKTRAKKTKM